METIKTLVKSERPPACRGLSSKTHQPAFSIWELLIVVAIIGVLIALLMPATQKVRETSQRTIVANNFKQIGLALNQDDGPLAAKVIYGANLQLIVNDFEEAEVELA